MFFRKAIIVGAALMCSVATAQDGSVQSDIQIGMQGLIEATKDPAVLAQLMKDLQVSYQDILN